MLPQARLRFLLADDAGAGKTIMAGLYIREMLARRLIRRVLIVPPAGLVGNWERELRKLFGLAFRIVGGGEARAGNPFIGPSSDLLIVSVDTLAGDRDVRPPPGAGRRALRPRHLRRGPQARPPTASPTSPSARPNATGWPRPWPASRSASPAGRWRGPATTCCC